jgi:hypothetical protein
MTAGNDGNQTLQSKLEEPKSSKRCWSQDIPRRREAVKRLIDGKTYVLQSPLKVELPCIRVHKAVEKRVS